MSIVILSLNARDSILYFFHGQNVVVLAQAIVKEEDRVPDIDIDRAIPQRELFTTSPETYTYLEPEEAENDEN